MAFFDSALRKHWAALSTPDEVRFQYFPLRVRTNNVVVVGVVFVISTRTFYGK